jgi:hypothetical protein
MRKHSSATTLTSLFLFSHNFPEFFFSFFGKISSTFHYFNESFVIDPLKALADCGAASLCFAPWETPACSRLFHGAKTRRRLYLELGIKRKKKQRKIARGIFRSLAPLLGTAGPLSDCGIKPTIEELNFSRR